MRWLLIAAEAVALPEEPIAITAGGLGVHPKASSTHVHLVRNCGGAASAEVWSLLPRKGGVAIIAMKTMAAVGLLARIK